MPDDRGQPQMWTLGGPAVVVSTGALAVLFAGFFVVCLTRHLGPPALAYAGGGAILMTVLTLGQWRAMKRRAGSGSRWRPRRRALGEAARRHRTDMQSG